MDLAVNPARRDSLYQLSYRGLYWTISPMDLAVNPARRDSLYQLSYRGLYWTISPMDLAVNPGAPGLALPIELPRIVLDYLSHGPGG